jgi:hypothetical protein
LVSPAFTTEEDEVINGKVPDVPPRWMVIDTSTANEESWPGQHETTCLRGHMANCADTASRQLV